MQSHSNLGYFNCCWLFRVGVLSKAMVACLFLHLLWLVPLTCFPLKTMNPYRSLSMVFMYFFSIVRWEANTQTSCHWDTFLLILFRTPRVVYVKIDIILSNFLPIISFTHILPLRKCTGSTSIAYTTEMTILSLPSTKVHYILRATSPPPERFITPTDRHSWIFLQPGSWRYTKIHLLVGKLDLKRCCSYGRLWWSQTKGDIVISLCEYGERKSLWRSLLLNP